jgi:polar amino acid transport system permease protein
MSNTSYAWSVLPALLRGLKVSVEATGLSMALALIAGVPVCLLRISRLRALRVMGVAIISVIRNTPLLAQLYVYFYVLPEFHIELSPLVVGVLGLGTHFTAYIAETYRAGYESVPAGQWEAAAALNLGRVITLGRIVAPQALRPTIPVLANYLLAMFKDTSVLTAVTVTELFGATISLSNESFRFTLLYSMMGLLYLAVCYPAGRIVALLERRLGSV